VGEGGVGGEVEIEIEIERDREREKGVEGGGERPGALGS
jgi:hypothetical protein